MKCIWRGLKATCFINFPAQHQSLTMTILRKQPHTGGDGLFRVLEMYFFSFQKHLALFQTGHAAQSLKNLCTTSAHQTGKAQNLTFVEVKDTS